jgi:hypothetical protein
LKFYQIKWKDLPEEAATWESEATLGLSPEQAKKLMHSNEPIEKVAMPASNQPVKQQLVQTLKQ